MSDLPSDIELKAKEAQALLNTPLFNEMFDGVREGIVRQMEFDLEATPAQTQKRLALLQGLPLLREYLENYVVSGQLENKTQQEMF